MIPAAPPILTANADGKPVDLRGMYAGRSAFLICGGPSFATLDRSLLARPGILTFGINNSARTFRPCLWTAGDDPSHFISSIWLDPKIIKFVPAGYVQRQVFDSNAWAWTEIAVRECPAVFTFRLRSGFDPATWLSDPCVVWGNAETSGGTRSTMMIGLRLLIYLGVRRVFLLGCDFKMTESYTYHFDQTRHPGSVKSNNHAYTVLAARLRALRPVLEAAGVQILNANPDSALDAFDKIAFNEAMKLAIDESGIGDVSTERTAGLYDQAKPTRDVPRNRFWTERAQIPALAHFIWLGSPLPPEARRNLDAFKALHPDWEVLLVTELPADMPPELRDAALSTGQLCQRADLIRLWTVHKRGGFYLDVDVLPLRSFDPLRHFGHVFFWEFLKNSGRLGNCVFGAAAGDAAVAGLVDAALDLIQRKAPATRCMFGPELFGAYTARHAGKVNVFPCHYVQPFASRSSMVAFTRMDDAGRQAALKNLAGRFIGGVWPFAVHTQGILTNDGERSSHVKTLGRADAVLRRLPSGPLRGAEIGVWQGRLSSYLLSHRADLQLVMVDTWRAPDSQSSYRKSGDHTARHDQPTFDAALANATRATTFAADRRRIIRQDSVAAAANVADASLDFVFLDAEHTYEAVARDITAWLPKLKPGALLCGHDLDNPGWPNWGVRRAVEQTAARLGVPFESGPDYTWFLRPPLAAPSPGPGRPAARPPPASG